LGKSQNKIELETEPMIIKIKSRSPNPGKNKEKDEISVTWAKNDLWATISSSEIIWF